MIPLRTFIAGFLILIGLAGGLSALTYPRSGGSGDLLTGCTNGCAALFGVIVGIFLIIFGLILLITG